MVKIQLVTGETPGPRSWWNERSDPLYRSLYQLRRPRRQAFQLKAHSKAAAWSVPAMEIACRHVGPSGVLVGCSQGGSHAQNSFFPIPICRITFGPGRLPGGGTLATGQAVRPGDTIAGMHLTTGAQTRTAPVGILQHFRSRKAMSELTSAHCLCFKSGDRQSSLLGR